MLIRVISKDGSWGEIEDNYLYDFIGSGEIVAFFCKASNEWVDTGCGFCDNCNIKHLASTDESHACFLHRPQKSVIE
jgi:hypothetical protein